MQRPILSYPRKFVPALAWSVRGAMLQLGGSLSIVDDDGAVVYEARANTRLTFAAIVLGLIAIGVLVGPTIIAIKWPTWMRRDTQPICTAFGAIALFLSLACYWISTQSLAVLLIENGTAIASLRRRPAVRTRLWEARSPSGQELGRVISNDTQILIFTPENRLVLTVASHLLPGVSQASWRQITIPGGAKGRLRIGLGAGSRLEIDDSIHAIDHPLLAALLLIVAIQGK